MSGFDDKINDDVDGTITDDNYTDPYSGNVDDTPPIVDPLEDLTEEDIADEEKGEPEDNEYIPILERNAPFEEEEAEIIEQAKQLRMIKGLALLGAVLWLS